MSYRNGRPYPNAESVQKQDRLKPWSDKIERYKSEIRQAKHAPESFELEAVSDEKKIELMEAHLEILQDQLAHINAGVEWQGADFHAKAREGLKQTIRFFSVSVKKNGGVPETLNLTKEDLSKASMKETNARMEAHKKVLLAHSVALQMGKPWPPVAAVPPMGQPEATHRLELNRLILLHDKRHGAGSAKAMLDANAVALFSKAGRPATSSAGFTLKERVAVLTNALIATL